MAFDAHKNFGYSTVLTAPSPATSGTSLVVQSGDGAKFPVTPFNATVFPVGVQPTTSNSEIVRVTTVSTDTLTIVRGATSGGGLNGEPNNQNRSIIIGDQIEAGISARSLTDIESGGLLTSSALATNAVAAANLATTAITLGYAQITSNFTTLNSTATQVTSLTLSVTIPAGGRYIKITAFSTTVSNTTSVHTTVVTIWDGTVGSGTQLSESAISVGSNNANYPITTIAVVQPAAGSKTYNVGLNTDGSGTGTYGAAATYPAFLLVECI